MFSVYGASGRLFRGTLEQLRQIGPVRPADRPRALEGVARDGRSGLLPAGQGDAAMSVDYRSAALEAYAAPAAPAGQRWGLRTAASIMSPEVLVLRDTDTAAQAWRLLERHHYGQAPVVNQDRMLVGLLTLSRLARWVSGDHLGPTAALAQMPVSACMLTPVPSVAPHADLRRVAGLLLESELPALPVVEDAGQVLGVVSRTDILRAVLDDTRVDAWG